MALSSAAQGLQGGKEQGQGCRVEVVVVVSRKDVVSRGVVEYALAALGDILVVI